jgi:hypothetical protein
MGGTPSFLNGGESLGFPQGMDPGMSTRPRRGLWTALANAGQDDMPVQDIVLGAKQLANPDNVEPRWDADGPPPTRTPTGTKLSPIPTAYSNQGDISNPDATQILPDAMRTVSTGGRLVDRIQDDPATRQNTGSTQELENEVQAGRPSLAEQMQGQGQQPSHLDQLQAQYDKLNAPAAPLTLKQKLLRAAQAFANPQAARQWPQQQQFEESQKRQERATLLSQIEAERRMQEQEDIADKRLRQMEMTKPPSTIDTDSGKAQWNPQTRQYEPIMINGQPAMSPQASKEKSPLQLMQERTPVADQLGLKGAERQHFLATGQMPAQLDKPPGEIGTWALQEDDQGNPVLFNSKTGQTKPAPNVQKLGTYQKTRGAGEDALGYAKLYMDAGKYTGSGDEALMEKYFELAKPSSGFRMTKDQMSMLQDARSWMDSLRGKAYHAIHGTWFAPEQRKQIVETMSMLEQAKEQRSQSQPATGGAKLKDRVAGKVLVEGKDF